MRGAAVARRLKSSCGLLLATLSCATTSPRAVARPPVAAFGGPGCVQAPHLRAHDSTAQRMMLQAEYLLAIDRPTAAAQLLQPQVRAAAEALAPAPVSMWQSLARAYIASADLDAAARTLAEALKIYPLDVESHLLAGELALAAADFGAAVEHLEVASHSDLWQQAVVPYVAALLHHGRAPAAVATALQVLRDAPANAPLCFDLAVVLEKHALLPTALLAYHQGRIQRPDEPVVALAEARVALRLGNIGAARAALLSLGPQHRDDARVQQLRRRLRGA